MRVWAEVDISLADRMFRNAAELHEQPEELYEQAGLRIMEGFEQLFDREGLGTWPDLDPATEADKEEEVGNTGILVRTGTLRTSMIERGAAGNIFEVTRHGVEVGTAVPHAAKHQFGEGVPERPIVMVTPQIQEELGELGLETVRSKIFR